MKSGKQHFCGRGIQALPSHSASINNITSPQGKELTGNYAASIKCRHSSTEAGARGAVNTSGQGFYSPVFLVPKKGSSKWRMIHIDIFNRDYLECPLWFKLTTLVSLRTTFYPGQFVSSINLQDTILHISGFPKEVGITSMWSCHLAFPHVSDEIYHSLPPHMWSPLPHLSG